MSYSFSVRKPTKHEALSAVAQEMEKVVQQQPVHAADKDIPGVAASQLAHLLVEGENKDISMYVNGSLQWSGSYPTDYALIAANVSVSVSLVERKP